MNCKYYMLCPDCEAYIPKCKTYDFLENLLNKQVRRSLTYKRVYRREHGHKHYEQPPSFSESDIALLLSSQS